MNALVSIIIPIYNAAKFLDQCIQSVISQTYKNWELLLLDDGSVDESVVICEKYALKDNRIFVQHKKNSGVSDTRNRGLDLAKGKYIIFLDSDDYWNTHEILFRLVTLAEENNADIVRAEYKEVNTIGADLRVPAYTKKTHFENRIINSMDFLENIVLNEFFLVLALINKDCIRTLRFNTHRIFLEDAEFYLKMLQQPLKCMYLPNTFYSYRKHEDSVTIKAVPGNKKLRDAFDFTRLCFSLSENTRDMKMKAYLIKKGIENYLFDVSVVGESNQIYKNRKTWFAQWSIADLDIEVKQIIKENNLNSKYKIALLSLGLQLRYFRYKFYTKLYIKKIVKIILNK